MQKLIAPVDDRGLLAIVNITPATAATLHPSQMTCREFLSLDSVERPKVVYWAEGVNHSGKPQDATIDIESTDRVVPIITRTVYRGAHGLVLG